MENQFSNQRIFKALFAVLILLAVFIGAEAINAFKEYGFIGEGIVAANVINVSGTGQVVAVPDTGTFSFSVTQDAKTAADAQAAAATKTNAIIAALKALGIAEKDIQTTNYSSYPTYEYNNLPCVQPMIMQSGGGGSVGAPSSVYPCRTGKQVLTGYEVSQSLSVKIRKTADSGTILVKVGELGATNISGLTLTVDDMQAVQAQARDKAIADAKAKAATLAKSLGVMLSKIVNFQESGNQPIYYAMDKTMSAPAGAPTPEIPVGQNTITSNVTISYEIQ